MKGEKNMNTRISLDDFEDIYNSTYNNVLKYVICNVSNIDDINEIVQDTYVELYMILKKKNTLQVENIVSYVVGIAKNKIYRHFGFLKRQKEDSLTKSINYDEVDTDIPDILDLEEEMIKKQSTKELLLYIKQKDLITAKVFYLYYTLDMKLSDIATELNITESNVKNRLYRTIKELRKKYESESD